MPRHAKSSKGDSSSSGSKGSSSKSNKSKSELDEFEPYSKEFEKKIPAIVESARQYVATQQPASLLPTEQVTDVTEELAKKKTEWTTSKPGKRFNKSKIYYFPRTEFQPWHIWFGLLNEISYAHWYIEDDCNVSYIEVELSTCERGRTCTPLDPCPNGRKVTQGRAVPLWTFEKGFPAQVKKNIVAHMKQC